MSSNIEAFKFADPKLKGDSEIAMMAIKGKISFLDEIDKKLFEKKSFVLKLIEIIDPLLLQRASETIRDDIDVVEAAVEKNPLALQFASNHLRNTISIVQSAINKNGLALEFASNDIRSKFNIVLRATKQNKDALKFAHPSLKKDVSFIAEIANYNLELAKEFADP